MAYELIVACRELPSIRKISDVLKAASGKGVRWSAIASFLKNPEARVTVGQHPGNTFEHDGQHPGNTHAGARADLKGFALRDSDSVDANASTPSSSSPESATNGVGSQQGEPVPLFDAPPQARLPKTAAKAAVRQPLGLVDARQERSREILALFWPRVELVIARSMTQKMWRARNQSVALEFATLGRTDAELIDAHAAASERLGQTIFMLAKVQSELLRVIPKPLAPESAPEDEPLYEDLVAKGDL